jgi:hypothetical protein
LFGESAQGKAEVVELGAKITKAPAIRQAEI